MASVWGDFVCHLSADGNDSKVISIFWNMDDGKAWMDDLSGQFVWDAARPMFICGNNVVMKTDFC